MQRARVYDGGPRGIFGQRASDDAQNNRGGLCVCLSNLA